MARFPIPESLRGIPPRIESDIAAAAHEVIARDPPAGIVLTTCHAGPEFALASRLFRAPRRPVVIGCQHGYVQNWAGYWGSFCFDHFLVFGEAFREPAPAPLQNRVHATGLPKLDAIVPSSRPPFEQDDRPILFAAQTTRTEEMVCSLKRLERVSGREVHVRPHPEFPDLFAGSGLPVAGGDRPLLEQIAACSLVVTSGSTTVLESLVAGCPCVVLPVERGDEYAAAGIVATTADPDEILAIASRQQQPDERLRVTAFLAAFVGAADHRAADRAARLIATLVEPADGAPGRSVVGGPSGAVAGETT